MGNRLFNVTDSYNDPATVLGDFKEGAQGLNDYDYDFNGNLISDANKGISSIEYNHLNLPKLITITGKGTIEYVYDASGNKLEKIVHETGKPDKSTTYIQGFVYENDTLEFLSHEEGRIRYNGEATTAEKAFLFDYFLKDHLGNVRSVITEEQQTDKYPVASLEDSKLSIEQNYYSIDNSKIVTANSLGSNAPAAYTNDNGIGNNPTDANFSTANSQKLYKLNGSSNPTGLGITLKVMANDKLDIFGKSYYFTNNTGGSSANTSIPILNLLTGLLGSPGAAAATTLHGAVTAGTINSSSYATTGIQNMLDNHTTESNANPQVPKAYINYLFFDEQFKCVGSGFSKIGTNGTVKDHYSELQNITVPKNGFVYIYCSNESPVDVFFDNLQVVHKRGPILEETSYYPFGLTMAGISSRAAGKIENKIKYQQYEFNSTFDLNLYESFYRSHDPQIGRFLQIDPKPNDFESLYSAMGNNPIRNVDILGDKFKDKKKDNLVAKEIKREINLKQKELRKESKNLGKQINDKLPETQKNEIEDKIEDIRRRVLSLEQSKTQLKDLKNDTKNTYTFTELDKTATLGGLYFEKDGTVNIRYLSGGAENVIHEVDHADGFRLGIIKAGDDPPTTSYSTKLSPNSYEANAYKRQYAFDPESLPDSDNGQPKAIDEVNENYVSGIGIYKDTIKKK